MLPDVRPIAVTASSDKTVRVWDLHTGTPIGKPLTGHTGPVAAVATAMRPDGRPIAITSSDDKTVRVWDLGRLCEGAYPLHVTAPVSGVTLSWIGSGLVAVVVADGVARVDLEVGLL